MYKKQEWKDEIPDLSRPILDGTGKQKVDPQTGRPLWELVQEGTRITSSRLNHMEDGIQAAHEGQNVKITRDDGTAQLAPDRDINNWQQLGVYSFNEAHVSTPPDFVRGLIFVYEDAEGVTYQMAWETDSRLAVRTKNEVGRWTTWDRMGGVALIDAPTANADSLVKSGLYRLAPLEGINNGMPDRRSYFVNVMAYKEEGLFQVAYAYDDTDDIYFRSGYKAAGQWSFEEWRKIVTSESLTKSLTGYMPKTGGDFNGSVGFNGYGSTMKFTHGTGDNATYSVYNNAMRVHWGLAMKTYDESVTGLWDSRIGRWITKGGFVVQSNSGNQWQVDDKGNQAMNGKLSANAGMDVKGDGPVQRIYGITHQYTEFHPTLNSGRSGYIGASDPQNPKNVVLSSDHGMLTLHGADGVFLNGRNVLSELDTVKQSGVNNKQALVDALNAKGIAASVNEDWGALIWKIRANIPSLAKITANASTGTAYFREATNAAAGRPEYCVTVTGLNFRAKYIMVHWWGGMQSPSFQAGYAAERGAKIFTESSFNTAINLVQGDTLPDPWRGYTIDATVTSNGFVIPVGNSSSLSGREFEIVAIG